MNLENEYYYYKQEIINYEKKLAEAEETEISVKEDEHELNMRKQAKERAINMIKSSLKDNQEIFEEVKEELIVYIKNGGEVSDKTLKELKIE